MSKKNKELTPEIYEEELSKLQVELSYLQRWVKHTGARVVMIFEGRDAAGKGGVIKTIMQRLSPRIFKTVALPTPTEREKTQYYLQRYINQYNRVHLSGVLGISVRFPIEEYFQIYVSGRYTRSLTEVLKYNNGAYERRLILVGITANI